MLKKSNFLLFVKRVMVGLFAFLFVGPGNLVIYVMGFPVYVELIVPNAFALHEIVEATTYLRDVGQIFKVQKLRDLYVKREKKFGSI